MDFITYYAFLGILELNHYSKTEKSLHRITILGLGALFSFHINGVADFEGFLVTILIYFY